MWNFPVGRWSGVGLNPEWTTLTSLLSLPTSAISRCNFTGQRCYLGSIINQWEPTSWSAVINCGCMRREPMLHCCQQVSSVFTACNLNLAGHWNQRVEETLRLLSLADALLRFRPSPSQGGSCVCCHQEPNSHSSFLRRPCDGVYSSQSINNCPVQVGIRIWLGRQTDRNLPHFKP